MVKNIYPVLLGASSVLTGAMDSTSGAPGTRNSALERSVGEMVAVPAGSFMMGSPSSEKGRLDNEGPQHLVSIKAFKIARYDVTRGQWAAFVAATGRPAPPNDCYVWAGGQVTQSGSQLNPGFSQTARDPVVCVSWNDVQDYLHWLATMTGKSYRLPTEAEWEYAARSGTSSAYYWGDAFDSIRVANNHEQTETVGAHPSNDLGLYDMSGNVWQWLADCYHDSYANAPIDGSAWVSGDCTRRVFRGGSWHVNPSYLRVAARHGDGPSDRNFGRGFRLAQDQ